MNRVKWKGPYIEKSLLEKIKNAKLISTVSIKTMSKNSVILPSFTELTFRVYNGKTFAVVKIVDEMVGHKLGEFVPTKKQFSYKKTKNK